MKKYNEYTCNNCGRVHFGISPGDAEKEVEEFNEMFENLTASEQNRHYGNQKASITKYEKCEGCGNSYQKFRISEENDCPAGSTLGPIMIDYHKYPNK